MAGGLSTPSQEDMFIFSAFRGSRLVVGADVRDDGLASDARFEGAGGFDVAGVGARGIHGQVDVRGGDTNGADGRFHCFAFWFVLFVSV